LLQHQYQGVVGAPVVTAHDPIRRFLRGSAGANLAAEALPDAVGRENEDSSQAKVGMGDLQMGHVISDNPTSYDQCVASPVRGVIGHGVEYDTFDVSDTHPRKSVLGHVDLRDADGRPSRAYKRLVALSKDVGKSQSG
jgi:hypothetical protein